MDCKERTEYTKNIERIIQRENRDIRIILDPVCLNFY